ncbi:MAG: hypothetical protein MJ236_01200 [Clostridia bacterium]|nr:hypothetical protein [Clostridia bacterium]
MEESITLNQKEIKKIIARYYNISGESIIQNKYSFTIVGHQSCEIVKEKENEKPLMIEPK